MTHGLTYWWSKDGAWWRRERIVDLGEEFGAEGPAVIDWLACEAKLQQDSGRVLTGWRSVARGAFVAGPDRVREVVMHAAEIGELDDLEVLPDGRRFRCRVSGWASDQERAQSAERSRRYREKKGSVTDRDGPLHDVEVREPNENVTRTGQDRKEETTNVEPDRLDAARDRLKDGQISELFAYWQQQCGHPHAKLTADRRQKIGARLREGYTPEQIRQAIDGAARAAFVNDDGKKFDDLTLICRSGSKLEDFIDRAGKTNGHGPAFAASINARSRAE